MLLVFAVLIKKIKNENDFFLFFLKKKEKKEKKKNNPFPVNFVYWSQRVLLCFYDSKNMFLLS
jgi:hypothetical protein